jgi:thiol-disulfide isomerase/thioredoxin
VIVLDFWYSACYPCIKSIPEVNKLYQKFKDRGVVVYGVNIIDDELKNKTRMEKYIRNNPMAYPTIMAERAKYQDWTATGYPMLVLLNSKYEIIEAHIGYSEDMADELSVLIEEHLND